MKGIKWERREEVKKEQNELSIPNTDVTFLLFFLKTKVTAIDGKPSGDQYLPNYLSISSWYSPSKCHIQLQAPDKPFQVGWLHLPPQK